jgi:hypothetical protein
MSYPRNPNLTWETTSVGLVLQLDTPAQAVPRVIASLLFGRFPSGLGIDPADDLLELERHLRTIELVLSQRWERIEGRAAAARASGRPSSHRWPRRPSREHRELQQDLTLSTTRVHRARQNIQYVCGFLGSIPGSPSPLAQARRGRLLPHARPGAVEATWSGANTFVADDHRGGARTPRGSTVVEAVHIGSEWRCDGDDPLGPGHGGSGTWTVGHIQSTDEVYAPRRSRHRPEELWLLATDTHPELVRRLHLAQGRMREPNSPILLAQLACLDRDVRTRPTAVAAALSTRTA